jgi:hypothetical protein
MRLLAPSLLVCLAAVACSSKSDEGPKLTPLPPVTSADETDTVTRAASHARQSYKAGPNPSIVDSLAAYESGGFGDVASGPGQQYTTVTFDGSAAPKAGPNAKMPRWHRGRAKVRAKLEIGRLERRESSPETHP